MIEEVAFDASAQLTPEIRKARSQIVDITHELLGCQWEDLISHKEKGSGCRLNVKGREVAIRWQEDLIKRGKTHQEIVQEVSDLLKQISLAHPRVKAPDVIAFKRVCLSVINRTRYDAAIIILEEARGEKLLGKQKSAADVFQKVKALKNREKSFYGLADEEWAKATELLLVKKLEEEKERNLKEVAGLLKLEKPASLRQVVQRLSQRLGQAFKRLASKKTLKRATVMALTTALILGVVRSSTVMPGYLGAEEVEQAIKQTKQSIKEKKEVKPEENEKTKDLVEAKNTVDNLHPVAEKTLGEAKEKIGKDEGKKKEKGIKSEEDISLASLHSSVLADKQSTIQSHDRVSQIKTLPVDREKLSPSVSKEKKDLRKQQPSQKVEITGETEGKHEFERLEGEISESERIVLDCVAEVKYLPQESYTWNGKIEMVTPTEIIIHWDAQENTDRVSTYTTYNGLAGRTASGDSVSTHFSVGPGGPKNGPAILQMLPMSETLIQRGILSDGPTDTINIETTGRYYDKEPPAEQQTENLIKLLVTLMDRYHLQFGNITGHLERSPDVGKIDPGQEYLNMVRTRLLATLTEQGRWDLIGSPESWYFYKYTRGNDGSLAKVSTQTKDVLLASLPTEVCQLITDKMGLSA